MIDHIIQMKKKRIFPILTLFFWGGHICPHFARTAVTFEPFEIYQRNLVTFPNYMLATLSSKIGLLA